MRHLFFNTAAAKVVEAWHPTNKKELFSIKDPTVAETGIGQFSVMSPECEKKFQEDQTHNRNPALLNLRIQTPVC